ncbi:MAG: DUF3599 family protein [Chloroflexi bacterium]|nr:DUF3599 family protein [Chloroflexota bacterium]
MAFATFLIHRCTINRIASTIADPYGQAVSQWTVAATDVPCRLIEKSEKFLNDERTDMVRATTFTLLVEGDTDVRESDRIAIEIDDVTRNFSISAVLNRQNASTVHHKSVALSEIG